MEVSYIKDGNKNIMLIKEVDINENDYRLQMILNNKIEGLLPTSIEFVDNKLMMQYNLSSKISFANMFARKHMTGKELYYFINDLKSLGEKLKEYLIDVNNIMFDVEYIFFNRQTKRYEFCYYVENKSELYINLRELFDKLLEFIDHNDKEAVLIAYGIQQLTISGDFTLQDIFHCANKSKKEYREEQEKENFKPENIVYVDESEKESNPGKSIIEKILKKFSKKNKYKTEDEMVSFDYEQFSPNLVVAEELEPYNHQEDMTTILMVSGALPRISLVAQKTEVPIQIRPNHFPYIIGKSRQSCDFCIDSAVISRVHLKISEEIDGFTIEDLSSTNGTFLNGERIKEHQPCIIEAGDKVALANLEFLVE